MKEGHRKEVGYLGGPKKEKQDREKWKNVEYSSAFQNEISRQNHMGSPDFGETVNIYKKTAGDLSNRRDSVSSASEKYEFLARTYEQEGKKDDASRCYKMARDLKKRLVHGKDKDFDDFGDPAKKEGGLEKSFSIISILALLSGLFFLSFSFTGNVVGNLANSTQNIVGGSLIIVGLVAGFFYIKGRK
ncbi:MAG: hypothetical protein Q8N88_03500 [Nanoarchaeota archaeon]|nr:hypothetical protein [Nanoarchaeota archaeon]